MIALFALLHFWAYGVDGFPTLVLIDKKGIVIYAGDFDKKLLGKLIKTALD